MSTVAPRPPAPPLSPALSQALVDSEGYIDDHIRRTRRSLKLVDAAAGILTLAVGLLGFLLVAGLVDHWIIPGGLGPVGRMLMFGLLLLGIAWYGWRQFVPLLRSINPVYAAHTIEQSAPSLKNSLLNVLLFRNHRQQMSAKVFHALEQQAAQRLSASHADAQIDHRALLRLGYALVAITAICALYSVLSPKNLAVSAARVLAPWTNLAPPSRVHITNVKPGDASVAIGERVAISAEISGTSEDDSVRVHYSTSDESLVDESIVMTRPSTALHFTADLPRATDGGSAGVQQPMEYWIEAGDARSPKYKLDVFQRPTIVVQRVRYAYPDYTREPPAVVDHVGDIRGIEGTTVTVEALASEPIKSAYVDFDGDGTSDKRMTVDGDRATASFTLELRDDRRTPWHLTYALRFSTPEGRTNDDPVQHRLDVQPDYSPEVRITQPEAPELAVHVGDTVMIAVEARDPDYALGGVRLVGRTATANNSGEVDVLLADLLATEHAGLYKHLKPFVPADAHLRPGDVLEYWAEARDNRKPDANLALSEHRKLRIVDADAPADPQQNPQGGGGGEQQEGGEGGGEDGQAGAAGGKSGGSGGESETGEGEPGASGTGGKGKTGESQENSDAGGEAEGGGSDSGESGENARGGGGNSDNQNAAADGQQREGDQNQNNESGEGSQNSSASQQPGERGQPGSEAGGASEPISSAGEQDAEAMSRINEHFDQQQAQEGGGGGTGAESEQQQQGPNNENTGAEPSGAGESASADGQNTNGASQDNATSSEQTPEGDGETPAAADGASNESDGGSPAGDQAGQPGAPEAGAKKPTEQNGDDSQTGAEGETGTDSSKGNQQSNARGDQGGDRSGDGNSGGGQQAPNAGQGQPGSHEPSDTGANQSSDPGAGETGTEGGNEQLADGKTGESSSDQAGQGSETGDAQGENSESPGAGEPASAGGQPGNPGEQQSGGESSGSQENQTQDAGGEQSQNSAGSEQQPGAGGQQPGQSGDSKNGSENSDQQSPAGEKGSAGQQSGAPGEQQGEGASQASAQPGGRAAGSQTGDPSQQQNSNAGENSSAGGSATNSPAGGTSGGGVNGDGVMSEPGGDDPNMKYARKQTDLVLQRLDEELADHKVDPSLLKSLGWTEAELRSFVDRWKSLKAAADAPGDGAAEAQQELDQALKAIGLRPRSSITIQGAATPDELRDLNEAARKAPPAEYADRVRAYLRAAAEEE
jgi:collagen type III alpha